MLFDVLQEMERRHVIINDREFWTHLEFTLTRWLADQEAKDLRCLWIDGFLPESITNTQYGVDVEGEAWVGTSGSEQSAYRFVASIPQAMIDRRRRSYRISDVEVDPSRLRLNIVVERENKNAEQAAPSNGG